MFMREIFADLMHQGALSFIDVILIHSGKWEQHIKLVNKVLKCLGEHNLETKWEMAFQRERNQVCGICGFIQV